MKKWHDWLANLSPDELLWLTAVFVSAMLGTLVSSTILRWGLNVHNGVAANLAICLLATAAYGGVVVAVFTMLFPQTRKALKEIFRNKN